MPRSARAASKLGVVGGSIEALFGLFRWNDPELKRFCLSPICCAERRLRIAMLAQDTTTVPYCGPPPSPAELWLSWNFDPILIGLLGVLACLYALGCVRLDHRSRG